MINQVIAFWKRKTIGDDFVALVIMNIRLVFLTQAL